MDSQEVPQRLIEIKPDAAGVLAFVCPECGRASGMHPPGGEFLCVCGVQLNLQPAKGNGP